MNDRYNNWVNQICPMKKMESEGLITFYRPDLIGKSVVNWMLDNSSYLQVTFDTVENKVFLWKLNSDVNNKYDLEISNPFDDNYKITYDGSKKSVNK